MRLQPIMCSLILVAGTAVSLAADPPAAEEPITIGIIGDQTGAARIERSYDILSEAVRLLAREQVDVTLHVGDILESCEVEATYRERFSQAVGILDRLKKPWYLTPGDHDVNPPSDWTPGSPDRSREAWFKNLYGSRVPSARNTLYYSFDLGGYHFIALNSQETLRVDPRWGNIFMAQLSENQFKWLKADLSQAGSAKAIVVFLHQPLWYNWTGWKRVHELLRSHPVAAVIAGHFHYDQDEGELDGIRYLVVGATGGDVQPGHRDAGNAHHVSILTLTGRRAQFRMIPIGTDQPLAFSSRHDMDRVQAVRQVFYGLGSLTNGEFIFLKDGTLVEACGFDRPARIQLVGIGNPIDVPLLVQLELKANGMKLTSSLFSPGRCKQTDNSNACLLDPGKDVKIANLSTVSTSFCDLCKPGAEPLWTGELAAEAGQSPGPGTPVALHLRLSFAADEQELFVEHDVKATVSACGKSSQPAR